MLVPITAFSIGIALGGIESSGGWWGRLNSKPAVSFFSSEMTTMNELPLDAAEVDSDTRVESAESSEKGI